MALVVRIKVLLVLVGMWAVLLVALHGEDRAGMMATVREGSGSRNGDCGSDERKRVVVRVMAMVKVGVDGWD